MTLDDMLYALDQDLRTDKGGCEQWAPCVKGLTESQVWKIMDTFPPTGKATPADFARARRRLFPPDPCTTCDDTGQLWDGERYEFCGCEMGAHMREVNERIATESAALRPVWARGVTEGMRRYEASDEPYEALCGSCGAPTADHRAEDLEVCQTMSPRRRFQVVP